MLLKTRGKFLHVELCTAIELTMNASNLTHQEIIRLIFWQTSHWPSFPGFDRSIAALSSVFFEPLNGFTTRNSLPLTPTQTIHNHASTALPERRNFTLYINDQRSVPYLRSSTSCTARVFDLQRCLEGVCRVHSGDVLARLVPVIERIRTVAAWCSFSQRS